MAAQRLEPATTKRQHIDDRRRGGEKEPLHRIGEVVVRHVGTVRNRAGAQPRDRRIGDQHRARRHCATIASTSCCSPSCCRSEEHTSELQSLMRISYAVFCLKKNKIYKQQYHNNLNTSE